MKFLRINVAKDLHELYTENQKGSTRETKEDLNKEMNHVNKSEGSILLR